MTTGIEDAVKAAGSQTGLADALGVTQQFISRCERRGYVPLHRAQEIEALYAIPRARLINPRLLELVDAAEPD